WLPQPAGWSAYAVDAQDGVAGSTLELYRAALRLRAELGLGGATLSEAGALAPSEAGAFADAGALAFVSSAPERADLLIVATVGGTPVVLPDGYDVVLASGQVTQHEGRTTIPGDTTVWARASV